MRDGTELVGWGMATGVWEALQVPIAVRIVLTANGHAEVACAATDIGTGTYTIWRRSRPRCWGCRSRYYVKLGNSTLPQSPVEGGSWIAASVSNGIVTTSSAFPRTTAAPRKEIPNSPLADATAKDVAWRTAIS